LTLALQVRNHDREAATEETRMNPNEKTRHSHRLRAIASKTLGAAPALPLLAALVLAASCSSSSSSPADTTEVSSDIPGLETTAELPRADTPQEDALVPPEGFPYCEVDEATIDALYAGLTVDQRIGQHLMLGVVRAGDGVAEESATALTDLFLGGVFVPPITGVSLDDPEGTAAFVGKLKELALEASGVPLFVSLDQEGGPNAVLNSLTGGTDTIGSMPIGATGDTQVAYEQFDIMAREVAALGFNMDLGPVLDTLLTTWNGNLNTRPFGPDADLNADLGVAALTALQMNLVVAVGKHFPGDGITAGNTHLKHVYVDKDKAFLEAHSLKPFRAAVDAGVDGIMTIPAAFTAYDPDRCAITSREINVGLLRGDLGFEGLIVTDSLDMAGATIGLTKDQLPAMEALKAGADILLDCSMTVEQANELAARIKKEMDDGTYAEAEFEASTKRILRMKTKYCLFESDGVSRSGQLEKLALPEDAALSRSHADRAVVLLHDNGVLPLTGKKVLYVGPDALFTDPGSGWPNVVDQTFGEAMEGAGGQVVSVTYFLPFAHNVEFEKVKSQVADADVLVMGTLQGAWSLPQQKLLNRVLDEIEIPVVHVILGVPFDYALSRDRAGAALALMGSRSVMVEAGAAVLYGQQEAGGTMLFDLDSIVFPELLEVPVMAPITTPPEQSVLPGEIEPCALYKDTTCMWDKKHSCDVYDSAEGKWAEAVPPMTEQAYMFDRYYDLYHEVEGQTMDFRFTQPVPAFTPEEEWSKPEYFRKNDGYGDASGWTGTAVMAAAGRYRATGTEADYERMVDKLEKLMFMYEVNDIPGMLIRSHWAMLPEGAPEPHGLPGKAVTNFSTGDGSQGHFTYPIDEKFHDRLPDYYLTSVKIDGVDYPTTPRFQGDASRDMYVRGLPGLMMAFDLLGKGDREDKLRAVIKAELPCTLNRMKKGRVFNLDKNVEIREALLAFLLGAGLLLDEGEGEMFAGLNELVFYVLEQPHPLHMDLFDPSCPEGPPMEFSPKFEFDATDPMFILDLAMLAGSEAGAGKEPIAWSQHISIRGSDAAFMTQWALTAHYLTGKKVYLDFLEKMMGEIEYAGSIHTYGALKLPKWCAPHFAPSLVYPSLYNLLARIDREKYPKYWKMLSSAAVSEGKGKDLAGREDCFWGILYHRMADETTDPEVAEFVKHHAELLTTYGMHPDSKLEPDRNYPRNFIDTPDPEIPLEEIPPEDLATCTEPIEVLGLEMPSVGLEDDWPRAVDAIPLGKRVGGAFLWQMDPFMAKREYGGTGMNEQWPMLGLTAPYWVGRADGVITEGESLGLGWKDTGEACNE